MGMKYSGVYARNDEGGVETTWSRGRVVDNSIMMRQAAASS